MAGELFLDSNVVLRYVLRDHPDHTPRAAALFAKLGQNEIGAQATASVIFEMVFTLDRQRKIPKPRIRSTVLDLLALPGLTVSERPRLEQALDLFVSLNIPYIDAYHAAAMNDLGCTQILSFDRHFDRVPGIERVEP